MTLPLLLSLLAAFYTGFGMFLVRLAAKPSCRVCRLRHRCPSRLNGRSQLVKIPFCLQDDRRVEAPALADR